MKKSSFFVVIAMSLVMSLLVADPVWATTSTDLQQKQNKLEQEQKALESQQKSLQSQQKDSQNKLNNANSQIGSISEAKGETKEAIDETNAVIVGLMTDIELIKEDIDRTQEQIEITQQEYDEAKKQEETLYEAMVQRVKFMYEKGNLSYVQILLTATSYADALNKAQYVEQLYEYDRIKLAEYVSAKEKAEAYGKQLEEEKAELETSKYELEE